jgi:hypothetical protein
VIRCFLFFAAVIGSSFAQAQFTRPVLLTGPQAQGSSLQLAKEVVQLAAQHGYNGVSFGIGMERFTDPNNIDLSGVKVITDLAMQSGLKYICWRLDVDIPNNQAWADVYNGGVIWPVQSRPVAASWMKIAAIWQATRDISAQEVSAFGGDPSASLLFIVGNEPGLGGTGAPSLGPWSISGFYYSLFQSTGDPTWFLIAFSDSYLGQPEGYIDPGFWTMLRKIRGNVKFNAKSYAVSFEGADSSLPGQMASTVGADAQAVYANCNGYGINVFGPNARKSFDSITGTVTKAAATPLQAGIALKTRVDGVITTIKNNPILTNEHVILTEFNITTARIPDFTDAFPYREELLKQMMNDPNLDAIMIFTAYTTEQSTNSVQLFNRSVVNGVVTITPVGSQAVGPAYVNLVP